MKKDIYMNAYARYFLDNGFFLDNGIC